MLRVLDRECELKKEAALWNGSHAKRPLYIPLPSIRNEHVSRWEVSPQRGIPLDWFKASSQHYPTVMPIRARLPKHDLTPSLMLWNFHPLRNKTKDISIQHLFSERASHANWRADNADNAVCGIQSPISVSLQRLLDLLAENGEDDHGVVSPTQFAFKLASQFVLNAEWKIGQELRSSPVVDSEGGIRITWKSGNKTIKLICPATPNAPIYIYQSSPTGSSVHNQNVTSAMLADRLSWLLHGDQSEQPIK